MLTAGSKPPSIPTWAHLKACETTADFFINAVGARQRTHFFSGEQMAITSHSPIDRDAECFEWESVLQAVDGYPGGRDFVIAELGAGFGRWSVNAICALRQCHGDVPFVVIAAEADASHFRWLREHLRDNGIRPERCRLFSRPVSGKAETVYFLGGDPSKWYGQAIVDKAYAKQHFGFLGRLLGRINYRKLDSATLSNVLASVKVVDLIDMDIQGAEASVVENNLDLLERKVLRLHISTHAHDIEQRILKALSNWKIERYFPCLGERDTPIGRLKFVDGVISATRAT
jgi:FkbM family methyltransferase